MRISLVSGEGDEGHAIKTPNNLFFSDHLIGFDVESVHYSPSSTKRNPFIIKELLKVLV
jgi:hypothetical protein